MNRTHQAIVIRDVCVERARQDALFPADFTLGEDLFVMLAVLGEEKGEADHAALACYTALRLGAADAVREERERELRAELIQTAAVAVKIVEMLDAGLLTVPEPPSLEGPAPSSLTPEPQPENAS